MLSSLLKRLLYTIPIALGVTLISFLLVYIAPGDPLNAIAPADAPADVIETLKVTYGLDRPLPVRYGLWVMRAVQGDLGASIATGRPVASEVGSAVRNTLLLAAVAALVGVVAGCVLGALAGYHEGGVVDRLATASSVVGVSVPHYWLGLVLTIVFAVKLGWFPAMGAGPGGSADGQCLRAERSVKRVDRWTDRSASTRLRHPIVAGGTRCNRLLRISSSMVAARRR